MAGKKLDPETWEKVRTEWDLGQLSLNEIAAQYGLSRPAITKRATKYAWPERPARSEVVTAIVADLPRDATMETMVTPRVALLAFERVIQLLQRHRAIVGRLTGQLEQCLNDIDAIRDQLKAKGKGIRLDQVDTIASIIAKGSQAMARLVPIERRAFGLSDADGPSEFDGFTKEQLEILSRQIDRALGRGAVDTEGRDVQ